MAGGWARDGAVQEQIEDTVKDAVALARTLLPSGEGSEHCEDCGETIPPKILITDRFFDKANAAQFAAEAY